MHCELTYRHCLCSYYLFNTGEVWLFFCCCFFSVDSLDEMVFYGSSKTIYRGTKNMTILRNNYNYNCMRWDALPESNPYASDSQFPLDGYNRSNAHNYCRSFSSSTPWCYLADWYTPESPYWDYCDAPEYCGGLFTILTLSTLGKISEDDISKLFSYFFQKTGFDISCKLYPMVTICICEIEFSSKKKKKNKNITSLSSAEYA